MHPTHISTAEAQERRLPGSDTFRHLMYRDDFHRAHAAVALNDEALKGFGDTLLLSRRHEFMKEMDAAKAFLARGEFPPVSAMACAYMEHLNYEHFKIACGFELHLKARLVAAGFVVHTISGLSDAYKALAGKQKKRPVTSTELLAVDDYRFDGTGNYLPGLSATSIMFSVLTEKRDYRQALLTRR